MRPTEDDDVRASLELDEGAVKGAVHTISSSLVMVGKADPRSGPESLTDAASLRPRLIFAAPIPGTLKERLSGTRIEAWQAMKYLRVLQARTAKSYTLMSCS